MWSVPRIRLLHARRPEPLQALPMHTMKRRDLPRGLATLFASMSVAACAHHDPADHVTGECKVALIGKCSSTQVETALSATDKATLEPLQNRRVGLTVKEALTAAEASLKANGFEQLTTDYAGALVQGEKNRKLTDRGSQILHAVINAKLPMLHGRPDHETTRALVTVHAEGASAAVHAEFVVTVWDSKGDAKTKAATDPQVYNTFFARFAENSRR